MAARVYDSHRPNITNAPLFQFSMVGMMGGMTFPPISVGHHRKNPANDPFDVIRSPRLEKGSMAAVMLNDKDAH